MGAYIPELVLHPWIDQACFNPSGSGNWSVVEWNSALATEKVQRLAQEITERLQAAIDPDRTPARTIDVREEIQQDAAPTEATS